MSNKLLTTALLLAYGPLGLMLLLYGIGLLLRFTGRPKFLSLLVERTRIPQAVSRGHTDEIP